MKLLSTFKLAAVVLLGTSATFARAQQENGARWLDLKKERETRLRIESVLKDVSYTHLREVLLVGSAALVVVSKRPSGLSDLSTDYDTYTVFSYGLDGKHPLHELWGGYRLQLLGDARFEPGTIPDVVFQYDHCVECEPDTYLAAFHYDSARSTWTIRKWNQRGPPGAVVGSQGYLEEWVGEFVYAVEDLDGDKFDDIGVWLREVNSKTREVSEFVVIYTVKEGKEVVVSRDGVNSQKPIKTLLCNPHGVMNGGWNLGLCAEFQSTP